jgi:hypothetical protein
MVLFAGEGGDLMIYATGDCHGDFKRFGMKHFPE